MVVPQCYMLTFFASKHTQKERVLPVVSLIKGLGALADETDGLVTMVTVGMVTPFVTTVRVDDEAPPKLALPTLPAGK